ncbi:Chloroperoxidase [Mycena amicta]|nr:Chloroperoxidase [Mycena amicta]
MIKLLFNLYILTWDAWLTLLNFLTPKRRLGNVVRPGASGAGGEWPEYVAPKEGDSRSCCPGLNAMANHGILPHDGRNISFRDLSEKMRATYNLAPTFCRFVPQSAADILHKDFHKDTLDLADLNLHNGIEHDASLTREDHKFDPDQDKPYLPFINELLASASGTDSAGTSNSLLTLSDLQRYSAKRRVEARAKNPDFSLAKAHKVFGSGNSSTLRTVFGGHVDDLSIILCEERLPHGWEPHVRQRMGYTLINFNWAIFKLEKGIHKYEAEFVDTHGHREQVVEEASTKTADVLV